VDDVLGRHGLVRGGLGAGAGDTFPTVLAGSFVVKFFPRRFDGGACFFNRAFAARWRTRPPRDSGPAPTSPTAVCSDGVAVAVPGNYAADWGALA